MLGLANNKLFALTLIHLIINLPSLVFLVESPWYSLSAGIAWNTNSQHSCRKLLSSILKQARWYLKCLEGWFLVSPLNKLIITKFPNVPQPSDMHTKPCSQFWNALLLKLVHFVLRSASSCKTGSVFLSAICWSEIKGL